MESFSNANWIALVSCLISLIALVKSFLTDKKAKRLDLLLKQQQLRKQDKEEDAKKADVEVNVVEMPKGSNNRLRFYNKGKAIAYHVMFEISSDYEDKIQLFMSKDYLPFPKLLPQQSFEVAYMDFSDVPHQTVKLTWDDDFGKGRIKEMIVDM